MENSLQNLDMYGVSFNINTFGKQKFKTSFGGGLTLLTAAIVACFIYIFGTDFFHKKNPNVVENDLVHMTSKRIELRNDKYAFMFRLQDGFLQPHNLEKIPYKLKGLYFHFMINEAGKDVQVCNTFGNDIITKCSNTDATKNLDLGEIDLNSWMCWDIKKITTICRQQIGSEDPDYVPTLGRHYGEKEYSTIQFDVENYVHNYEKKVDTFVATKQESEAFLYNMMLAIR